MTTPDLDPKKKKKKPVDKTKFFSFQETPPHLPLKNQSPQLKALPESAKSHCRNLQRSPPKFQVKFPPKSPSIKVIRRICNAFSEI
jgi:hypothetical protein